MELRHNCGVDQRMLAALPLSAPSYSPRGHYRVQPRYAKYRRPRPVRLNSERDVLPPVEPLPASQACAARVFAGVVGMLDGRQARVPAWTGARCVHVPRWMPEDEVRETRIRRTFGAARL